MKPDGPIAARRRALQSAILVKKFCELGPRSPDRALLLALPLLLLIILASRRTLYGGDGETRKCDRSNGSDVPDLAARVARRFLAGVRPRCMSVATDVNQTSASIYAANVYLAVPACRCAATVYRACQRSLRNRRVVATAEHCDRGRDLLGELERGAVGQIDFGELADHQSHGLVIQVDRDAEVGAVKGRYEGVLVGVNHRASHDRRVLPMDTRECMRVPFYVVHNALVCCLNSLQSLGNRG